VLTSLQINYDKVTNVKFDSLPSSEFMSMVSNPLFLGDPLVDSQHLIGAAAKWEKESEDLIVGYHQTRAAHIRWTTEKKTDVQATGHGHGHVEVFYRKVEGEWKWGGITTHVRWNEHDWESIFLGVDGKKVGVSESEH
jgi:scytalone dehydratase